ncbi:uncharacterized protein LOC119606601 [Lucilia sericata]|uniref:uncharacterized protein LOC119606601 n=1 Tax=Lucilia sericata TaxID=13632 RepID=UPI0018A8501A|nr:uncharacterized protein LOC119606601 [Lucilia sericata]
MKEPPDTGGNKDPPDSGDNEYSKVNHSIPLNITTPGPKYLIITRTDEGKTLTNVSHFLIKKVIDGTCGEVSECKKLRNGTILVRTKNLNQANKLIQLNNLCENINILVTWHNSLNYVKGVIYSNDLREIPDDEILNELKNQNVIKIEKIKRKVNNKIEETGLIIITFGSTTLPTELNIGYERVKIRTYIPLPLRFAKQTINNNQSVNIASDQNETTASHSSTNLNNTINGESQPNCSHHSISSVRTIVNYNNVSDIEVSEHEMEQLNNISQTEKVSDDNSTLSKTTSDIEISENETGSTQQKNNTNNVIFLPRTTSNRNKQKVKQKTLSGRRSKRVKI